LRSGETSFGKFPVVSVHMMSHVAEVTEESLDANPDPREPVLKLKTLALSNAVAKGVRQMVKELRLKLVVLWSQTGATAQVFSKTRFPVPIVALSSDHRALRRMAMHYGVIPQEMAPADTFEMLVQQIDDRVQSQKFAAEGDRIVVVTGSSLGTPGMMNGVLIHTIGDEIPLAASSTNAAATAEATELT